MNAKTILLSVDFSEVTERALDAASSLAAVFDSQIILLHVQEPEPNLVGFEPGPLPVRMTAPYGLGVTKKQLDRLKQRLNEAGREVIALHLQGPVVEKILFVAREQGADLIVIGSHGHGALYNLLVGSITSGVLKAAPCPVLVVPALNR